LPAGVAGIEEVFPGLGVPRDDAAHGIVGGDEAHLFDGAGDGRVVAVIVVYVEKRVGERAAGEGVLVRAALADQHGDGFERIGFDGDADEVRVLVDGPHALGLGVGGRRHDGRVAGRSDGALVGRLQVTREKLVEGFPVRRVFVPAPLEAEGRIGERAAVVGIAPRAFPAQEEAPLLGKLDEPGAVGLMVLERVVVIALVLERIERLVVDEVEVVEALVDLVVERGAGAAGQDRPRQRRRGAVDEGVVLVERLRGVGDAVGVGRLGLGNGFGEQLFQFAVVLHHRDELLGVRHVPDGLAENADGQEQEKGEQRLREMGLFHGVRLCGSWENARPRRGKREDGGQTGEIARHHVGEELLTVLLGGRPQKSPGENPGFEKRGWRGLSGGGP